MLALVVLGIVLVIVAVETTLHDAARRAERRRAEACPFDDPDEHLRSGDVALLIASESVLMLVALLTTPLVWLRARGSAERDTRVVVVQAPGSLPGVAMPLLSRLRAGGHRPLLVRLPWRGVDATLAWLAVRLAAARHATGEPLDVVALGGAGLWMRALVARHGRRAGVGRLLTVGTPHGGTEAARWPPLDWLLRRARPGRPLVTTGADAARLTGIRECLAFASEHDALVEPPDAAYWPGAFNVRVQGLGHLGLAASPRIFEVVRENLLEADTAAAARAGDASG
jgi:hypothetical protein